MKGINKVLLIGNVCQDPEIRYTGKELAVANITVATNEIKKGEKVAEYHKCVAFGDLVENFIKPYLKQGAPVYIEGSLQTSNYTDKTTGVKKYSTQIIIRDLQDLGGKKKEEPQEQPQKPTFKEEDFNDDIPF
tara:strand:- start:263 stop:661 length:399 start_codon:yes stop_codon:yes gene_type:complete